MSTARPTERATTSDDWIIRLPCGHEVEVPWGSAVPAQMACIVHHHAECVEPLDAFPPAWWAPPLAPPTVPEGSA